MPDKNVCANCPAWSPYGDHSGYGECKFNPPVRVQDKQRGVFPVTPADGWCLPGRGLMYQAKMQQEASTTQVEDESQGYQEL